MREAAIVATARTGIGKAYRGAFNDTEVPVLAAHVVNAAIARAGIDPARVDDVYLGVGNQWGTQSYNVGRLTVQALTNSDYPVILAITAIGSMLVMLSNLLVDVLYPLLDPRAVETRSAP